MDKNMLLDKIEKAKNNKTRGLDLSNCGIDELPSEIGELGDLVTLDLGKNRLKSLPESISRLKNLEILHLRENEFDEFPQDILGLENLYHLCISENQISSLPENINRLKNLTDLLLANNKISELPDTILELTNLNHLCLKNNEVKVLPKNIDRLNKMERLHLQNNKLTRLPFSLSTADYIPHVSCEGNPIVDPPLSVISQGQGALLSYFLEKERGRIFKIPIDSAFRTPLKQYLNYFNDFVAAAKGIQVNFEVVNYDEGIELNIKVTTEDELLDVQKYLQEYISFTKANIDNLTPEFKFPINDTQKDIVIADLRNQVRSLQSSLEIRAVEIKYLNKETEMFYNLLSLEKKFPPPLMIQNDAKAISLSNNRNEIGIDIKNELPQLQNEIFEFKKLLQGNENKETLSELDHIDTKILGLDECETDSSKIDKVPFKKLKRILDEVNNEDSTLGKAVKASGKAIEAAQKLAKTYNKFAQWLAMPQVPDVFLIECINLYRRHLFGESSNTSGTNKMPSENLPMPFVPK